MSGRKQATGSVVSCDTHHFAEVTWQVGPLWVVEDTVVPAPGPTGVGHHSQYAKLTGRLERQDSSKDLGARGNMDACLGEVASEGAGKDESAFLSKARWHRPIILELWRLRQNC